MLPPASILIKGRCSLVPHSEDLAPNSTMAFEWLEAPLASTGYSLEQQHWVKLSTRGMDGGDHVRSLSHSDPKFARPWWSFLGVSLIPISVYLQGTDAMSIRREALDKNGEIF